jgi:hypothetical protein
LNELLFLLVVMLVLTVAGAECAKMSSLEQLDFAVAGQLKERILDTRAEHATCFPVTAPTAGSRAATAASGGAAEREDNASALCQCTVRSEAKKRMEHEADPAGATAASSRCGRNRTLAVHLACSGPLAGLKRSLGGRKWCDAGLRPLWAGSTGMQRFDAASCQPVSIEGCRLSCAVGSGLRCADLPGCDGLLGTAVLVQRWDEVLGPAVGKAEPFFGFVEVLGLSVSDAGVVHGAGREKITKPYPFKRENPQNYTPLPLYTKVACMIHGMLQYMVQEYLFRSIVRGAVQSETDII